MGLNPFFPDDYLDVVGRDGTLHNSNLKPSGKTPDDTLRNQNPKRRDDSLMDRYSKTPFFSDLRTAQQNISREQQETEQLKESRSSAKTNPPGVWRLCFSLGPLSDLPLILPFFKKLT
jgi:hypothetical protein